MDRPELTYEIQLCRAAGWYSFFWRVKGQRVWYKSKASRTENGAARNLAIAMPAGVTPKFEYVSAVTG